MLVARIAASAIRNQSCQGFLKIKSINPVSNSNVIIRSYREGGRTFARRTRTQVFETQKTFGGLKKRFGALEIGQLAAGGAGVIGLGALCFYGLGLSNEPGAIDHMYVWPQYVRQRMRDTYLYFGASITLTASSAVAFFRSSASRPFFNLCARHPILSTIGILVTIVGTGQAMMGIPYSPGFGAKQMMWLVNCGVLGIALSPVGMFGGALAVRAAWYTAGLCGGLSLISICAPSDRFLNWAGPLSMGLGAVIIASLGSVFLPPTSAIGIGLYSISLYGGLILFSALLLYDTQKIVRQAETYPNNRIQPFDPINCSHRVVMDAINIFVRIVQILAMGGARKK